ncbi:hypothetical protein AL1_18510 [Alistipes shahii WAL 8301]|uniref:Uncharacterized protein n=1 Tax=Alistipes shahii WAL 8301 TaxID=717959 RepID=D4IMQ5_9BACT|nr:hypothetical protein AL1_18510 [Alistipes shahii WAL 8301]
MGIIGFDQLKYAIMIMEKVFVCKKLLRKERR